MKNIIVTGLKIKMLNIKKYCKAFKVSRIALPFIWHARIKMPNKGHLS